jgi:hypothetical protein
MKISHNIWNTNDDVQSMSVAGGARPKQPTSSKTISSINGNFPTNKETTNSKIISKATSNTTSAGKYNSSKNYHDEMELSKIPKAKYLRRSKQVNGIPEKVMSNLEKPSGKLFEKSEFYDTKSDNNVRGMDNSALFNEHQFNSMEFEPKSVLHVPQIILTTPSNSESSLTESYRDSFYAHEISPSENSIDNLTDSGSEIENVGDLLPFQDDKVSKIKLKYINSKLHFLFDTFFLPWWTSKAVIGFALCILLLCSGMVIIFTIQNSAFLGYTWFFSLVCALLGDFFIVQMIFVLICAAVYTFVFRYTDLQLYLTHVHQVNM